VKKVSGYNVLRQILEKIKLEKRLIIKYKILDTHVVEIHQLIVKQIFVKDRIKLKENYQQLYNLLDQILFTI